MKSSDKTSNYRNNSIIYFAYVGRSCSFLLLFFIRQSVALFIAADDFNCLTGGGPLTEGARCVAKRIFAEMREVGEVVEAIALADYADALIALQQVVEDVFTSLVENPYIDGHAVKVLEHAAEGSRGITTQMCKLLGGTHLGVMLHHEVLEALGVGADGVEEGTDDLPRIIVGHDINQLFTLQFEVGTAGRRGLTEVVGQVGDETAQFTVEWQWGVGDGGFGEVGYFAEVLPAKGGNLVEAEFKTNHVGSG